MKLFEVIDTIAFYLLPFIIAGALFVVLHPTLLNERTKVQCVALDKYVIECYGDDAKYDGQVYDISDMSVAPLEVGHDYYVMINTGITKNNVTDDTIDFVGGY